MLIAFIVIICLFFLFLIVSYFLGMKKYEFDIEGKKLMVVNRGSNLKIYLDEKMIKNEFAPPLIHGVTYIVKINENDYKIRCRTTSLGYKMQIEVFEGEKLVTDNGVKLKKSAKENA